jgi:hypothetical protein
VKGHADKDGQRSGSQSPVRSCRVCYHCCCHIRCGIAVRGRGLTTAIAVLSLLPAPSPSPSPPHTPFLLPLLPTPYRLCIFIRILGRVGWWRVHGWCSTWSRC